MRRAFENVNYHDYSLFHREINSFLKFKDEIIKWYNHVSSYKELLLGYCSQIEKFKKES
jgi:hypothetical protein